MSNKPKIYAPIATGSTEPRDLRDRFADVVNVKDFGAVPTDTTEYNDSQLSDNTDCVQSAINVASVSNKAVWIPKGVRYFREFIDDKNVLVIDDSSGYRIASSDYWWHPSRPLKKSMWVAHRGMSAIWPENTVSAFIAAAHNGAYGIETDIQWTADGEIVCIHDYTLNRTTNGTGNVSDMTLAEIRNLDASGKAVASLAGLQVPTIDEYLSICRRFGCAPFIEIKTANNVTVERITALIEKVREYNLEDSAVILAFSWAYLIWARIASPKIAVCGLKSGDGVVSTTLKKLAVCGGRMYFGPSVSYIDNTTVDTCAKAGIGVYAWTVTSRPSLDNLKNMNVFLYGANTIFE